MSVFICDKTLLKFHVIFSQLTQNYFQKLFRHCSDLNETFLKPFNKLVVRFLSHTKHSALRRVLYVIKHSYLFIKLYINPRAPVRSITSFHFFCSQKILRRSWMYLLLLQRSLSRRLLRLLVDKILYFANQQTMLQILKTIRFRMNCHCNW